MHMQIYEHCQSSCSFPKPANSLSPVESSEISAHRLATSGEINCFWLMQKLGSFPWRMEMVIPASIRRGQPKREISRTCAMVRSAKKRVKEVKKNCGELRNIPQRCYRRLWIAEVEAPAAECDAQLIISEYIAPFGGINLGGL